MSFDITDLNLTAEPEVVAPEEYTPPYNTQSMPIDKGTYNGNLVDGGFKEGNSTFPVVFSAATSKKNGQSYLAARFAMEIPEATINKNPTKRPQRIYGRVDTIPEKLKFENYKETRANANAFMDLLKALGYTGSLTSNEDYRNAIIEMTAKQAAGRVRVDKQAYCNPKSTDYEGCGHTIRGEDSFIGITDESGAIVDVGLRVKCPAAVHNGDGPVLLAQNEIKAVYPAKKG
jgi:hypothetical protein